jgi:hypothetical protein
MSSHSPTQVVSGPSPDEYGNARFVVRVGDRFVHVVATVDGCGVGEADFDVSAQVAGAISEFRQSAPQQMLSCLRAAAKLRRSAGHPTELAVTVPDSIVVRPEPDVQHGCVRFTVDVEAASVLVVVTREGAVVDGYDLLYHPDGELQPESLLVARRAVLNFVLARADRAAAWGVDCELLDLLWN